MCDPKTDFFLTKRCSLYFRLLKGYLPSYLTLNNKNVYD